MDHVVVQQGQVHVPQQPQHQGVQVQQPQVVQQEGPVLAVPALLQGPQGQGPVQQQQEPTPAERWAAVWGPTVAALATGNHVLGPDNGAAAHAKLTAVQRVQLIADFVDSLADFTRPAAHARALLDEMRAVLRPANAPQQAPATAIGLGPSTFPTLVYNDLLEVVNAKALWLSGDMTLTPWPFDADALKPDYRVGAPQADEVLGTAAEFYGGQAQVGDHVRVSGKTTHAAVETAFGDSVRDKLTTYAGKQVQVVVDLVGNRVPARTDEEWRAALDTALDTALQGLQQADRQRLTRAVAVVAPGTVVTVRG